MVAKTSYEPGTPCWIDLGSPDPAAAASFDAPLFGWEVAEGPPEAGGYRMCLLRGEPVAGISPQFVPEQPAALGHVVNVADADEAARDVAEHGGVVGIEPFDVLAVGRMAAFLDPAGATFAVWEPRGHIGAALVNEPGALCWNELNTPDVEAAMAFDGPVFGWTCSTMPMGDVTYDVLMLGDRAIGGLLPSPGSPWWQITFAVVDGDEAVAAAAASGASVRLPAADVPDVGRCALLADPHGAQSGVLASEWWE